MSEPAQFPKAEAAGRRLAERHYTQAMQFLSTTEHASHAERLAHDRAYLTFFYQQLGERLQAYSWLPRSPEDQGRLIRPMPPEVAELHAKQPIGFGKSPKTRWGDIPLHFLDWLVAQGEQVIAFSLSEPGRKIRGEIDP